MKIRLIFLFLFLILFLFCLNSHPHLFFFNRYELVTQDKSIKGMWVEWVFDDYFTQDILMYYDLNSDKVFSKSEIDDVYNNAFINLGKYNYFQQVRQGDKRFSIEEVNDFSVFLTSEGIAYRFYIKLDGLIKEGELFIATFDPTFFCANEFIEKDPVIPAAS